MRQSVRESMRVWACAAGLRCGQCAVLWLLVIVIASPALAQPDKDKDPLSFDRNISGLLNRYCYRCHQAEDASGDIDLKKDENPRLILANAVVWRTALEKLASGEMPPEDARQPTDEERSLMIKFLTMTLDSVDCDGSPDPGEPAVRRLNRVEYNNSIQFLTGLDLRIADEFPPDASSYGFENIATSLTLTPVQVEQYYAAAKSVVEAILQSKDQGPQSAYRQVFFVEVVSQEQRRDTAKQIATRFATRAFRRPVNADWIERLMTIYDRAIESEYEYDRAVGQMLTAVLVSPRFLLRAESVQEDADKPYRVDDYDLASRLSFFLWSGPPDQTLLDVAAKGKLSTPKALAKQVRRMLDDPRSDQLIENFFAAWLQFESVDQHQPDAKTFPSFSQELKSAIAGEPREILREVLRKNRPLTDLIDADYTFVNRSLAAHYGLPAVPDETFIRVSLQDRRRGGLLTTAALLMIQADPNRTNVPRRGNFIAATILGTPSPPPPPDVPELSESDTKDKPLTLRERFELHRSQAQCASCHDKIDPLGFAFENYDAVGAWRDQEVGKPIDASGELPDGSKFGGPEALKDVLLSRKQQFAETFAKQLLIYALGRGPIASDQCVLDEVVEQAAKDNFRVRTFIEAIVNSDPFLYRRNSEF